jgi:hypothetical protein
MRLNWNVISVRLEIVLTLMQDRCMVCAKRTIGSEIVLDAPMEVLGDKAQWKLVSLHLETMLVSVQEWCTISVP